MFCATKSCLNTNVGPNGKMGERTSSDKERQVMSQDKSSIFNLNLFGVQTKVKQKILLDQSSSETEIEQGISDLLANASSMESQLRMTSQGLAQYRELVGQLEMLSKETPIKKPEVKTKLIDISNVIEGTASGLAAAGLIAMIQALVAAI